MQNQLLDMIPGYRDAVRKEGEVRVASYFDIEQQICGIKVQPLTLRTMALLEMLRSPFAVGVEGLVTPNELTRTLWILHKGHSLRNTLWQRMERWLFIKRVRKVPYSEVLVGLASYFDDTFMDSPSGGNPYAIPRFSWIASMVDMLAREYGWREEDIVNRIPIKRLFQYIKAITVYHNPTAILFNPSDTARREGLQQTVAGKN